MIALSISRAKNIRFGLCPTFVQKMGRHHSSAIIMPPLNESGLSLEEKDSWNEISQKAQPGNQDDGKFEKVGKLEFVNNLSYEQEVSLAREDIKCFMAPMHFPSVDPRRLHCKKFASIKKFVQENQVMRIVRRISESEDAESDKSVSYNNESDAEEKNMVRCPN